MPTKEGTPAAPVRELLRVGEGFDLASLDPASTPGCKRKTAAAKEIEERGSQLSELQERLYAESREGGQRALLLVVQGMDTSGKGGIMRHVIGAVDPQGTAVTAFKQPTEEERAHPFLWRIRRALPRAGMIGVFDRSHYEDVLIVRVHNLVPPHVWKRRYSTINRFERDVVAGGTTMIKVMLHISRDEQKQRLLERLDRPDKHWKYNPSDVDERTHWDAYQEAYSEALTRCSTAAAPWFAVPADRKWYARWAVFRLLLEHLEELNPQWPPANFDVAAERRRLLAT